MYKIVQDVIQSWKCGIWTVWMVVAMALQLRGQCRIDTLIQIGSTDTVVWEIEVRGVLRNWAICSFG